MCVAMAILISPVLYGASMKRSNLRNIFSIIISQCLVFVDEVPGYIIIKP
jgi:hypothetical protein